MHFGIRARDSSVATALYRAGHDAVSRLAASVANASDYCYYEVLCDAAPGVQRGNTALHSLNQCFSHLFIASRLVFGGNSAFTDNLLLKMQH